MALPYATGHAAILNMANYADSTRTPRTLTEREQRLLLKVTGCTGSAGTRLLVDDLV